MTGIDEIGEGQRLLRGATGPTLRLADRSVGISMVRRWAVHPESFQMLWRGIAFVAGKSILRIDLVPIIHDAVALDLGNNRGRCNGNGAGITVNERLLLAADVKHHRVNQEVVRRKRQGFDCGRHSLAAGLIDVPSVDARRVHFRDRPGERVLANARREFFAVFGSEFLGIVEADDSPSGIQDYGRRYDRAEERATSYFVNSCDSLPTVLPCKALVARGAEP